MVVRRFVDSKKLVVIYLLLFLIALVVYKNASFSNNRSDSMVDVEVEGYSLEYIRKNYLIPYDPTLPTNYTIKMWGWAEKRMKLWKEVMPKIIAERLNFKRNGFFVECGALDGIYISNTLHLERTYGWTGLLVEADPLPLAILKKRNRNAWVAGVCMSTQPHPMEVEMLGHKDVNGITYIDNDEARGGRAHDKKFNRKWKVQCFPFSMLMAALNRTHIDYFSLDVEGVELDILKTIPFDKIYIKLISVEVYPGSKAKIHEFLESKGYKRIKEIVASSDFLKDDLYERQEEL